MDATHTPSPLAASDEQSQAPACQRGRTHGVYAPRVSEDASGAMQYRSDQVESNATRSRAEGFRARSSRTDAHLNGSHSAPPDRIGTIKVVLDTYKSTEKR